MFSGEKEIIGIWFKILHYKMDILSVNLINLKQFPKDQLHLAVITTNWQFDYL